MRRAPPILALLALAACGPGTENPDDDGSADGGDDAMGGLAFVFHADDIDQTIGGVTVERIELNLRDIRAVGDAAPGDARTTLDRASFEVQASGSPQITFGEAPPGRYSSFEFVVDPVQDGEPAWSIEGTAPRGAETWPFHVEDVERRSFSLPLDLQLEAGHTATIAIAVDVIAICEGIDWLAVPAKDDEIAIESDSPEMPAIRLRFQTAFSVDDVAVE